MSNGLYLPDGSYMRFAEPASTSGSLSEEIAVRSRSMDYYAIGNMYLPNPDPVLKAQGKDIQVYTDLLIDDRVGGGLINRTGAAKSLVCSIERGTSSTRQFKAVKDVFAGLKINAIIETILKARGYGYAPIEVIWGSKYGLTVPLELVGKPQRWFVYGQANDLRFRSRDHLMDGEELPSHKFICPTNEASYDNPYGLGLLSRCFWPVVFKKGGWRFWIQFSEKYGQVWPIGKLPRSAGTEQQNEMLDTLARMIQDGVAVIPDDGTVDFKESGTKGATSALYKDIIGEANNAISTIWLGHAGAGESTPGKLGGESAATAVRDDIRDDDANLIAETLQQVVNWICEINWGSVADAPLVELKQKEQIDTTQAERDDKLTQAMERSGKRLTTAYYIKTYSLDPEDIEDTPANPPASPEGSAPPFDKGGPGGIAFADPAPDTQDSADITTTRLSEVTEPVITKWLQALKQEVDQAGNLIDLRSDLLKVKGLDLADLAAPIRDGLLLSRLAGRAEVIDEIGSASLTDRSLSGVEGNFAEASLISALNLPFKEAINFFRNKISIPTERWNDLFLDQHSQGFMIAGAIKGDLISDIRDAVDQAISSGLTLQEFRKQWDAIVERHGWSYNGGRNWRTRIVYETNTRQAYNAGRWQQVTDPDVLKTRPYLVYRHGDSVRPRQLHLAWNGTVLPADDPWWATHTPQNGWGCKCKIFSAGERDIKRMGDTAKRTAPQDGSYSWTDKQGRTFQVPNGIDPGFQYNPGQAAQKSKSILNDRINQLPPDIAKGIRAEIAQGEKQR
ncbi:MAG: DUF935 family protein [Geobacter sp.]|nr:DUF935 family protein [Geobacter sp.]